MRREAFKLKHNPFRGWFNYITKHVA